MILIINFKYGKVMTSIIKTHLDEIEDYELQIDSRTIVCSSSTKLPNFASAVQVAIVLNNYEIDYYLDDDFNFLIIG